MSEPTVLAEIAIYDLPKDNLDAVAHMLVETGFSITSLGDDGVRTADEHLVHGRRYYCDEFRSGDEIFERLADRGVVGLFWNSADYLWSFTLVYIAKGECRKLPSEMFKPVPLVPAPLVEAVLQDGSLGRLYGARRGDGRGSTTDRRDGRGGLWRQRGRDLHARRRADRRYRGWRSGWIADADLTVANVRFLAMCRTYAHGTKIAIKPNPRVTEGIANFRILSLHNHSAAWRGLPSARIAAIRQGRDHPTSLAAANLNAMRARTVDPFR